MTEPAGIAARWQALTSLAYSDNYPTDETLATLFDEMDFQRACQCYIWAMPTVALNEINVAQTEDLGVQMNEIALFQDFVGPESIGLTPNTTTIYALGVVDLASAGPMVVDIPEGAYGVIDDYWQRPVVEVGVFGPDQGKGGTFLLLPPGFEGDMPAGYYAAASLTNRVVFVLRALVKDDDVQGAVTTLQRVKRATGSRPSRARAGSPTSAGTAHRSLFRQELAIAGYRAHGATAPSDLLTEPAHHERAFYSNSREVAVNMHDAEIMVKRGLGDEEVRDRDAMPHPVMMGAGEELFVDLNGRALDHAYILDEACCT